MAWRRKTVAPILPLTFVYRYLNRAMLCFSAGAKHVPIRCLGTCTVIDLLNQWIEIATAVYKQSGPERNGSKPYQLSLISPF